MRHQELDSPMNKTPQMETFRIPGTKLAPSRIGLGTWAIGGWMWGGTDETESIRTIHAALDRGITLIDTAPVYGFGRSEEIVGKALAEGGRRAGVVLATKVGLDSKNEQPFRNGSRVRILKEIDDSLRRLRTDVIDLYQVHWPDPKTPIEETAGAMAELHKAGKIRAIGVSNFSRRGLLSGRMRADTQFPPSDLRSKDPKFQQPHYGEYLAAVSALDRLAQQRFGKRVIHLALRWVLDRAPDTIALWGARHPGQLDPVSDVLGWTIDADSMREIDRTVAQHVRTPLGPEFMAPPEQVAA
jgi:aryl-alcohol dehydrogenase-like predicted oxidoreductase